MRDMEVLWRRLTHTPHASFLCFRMSSTTKFSDSEFKHSSAEEVYDAANVSHDTLLAENSTMMAEGRKLAQAQNYLTVRRCAVGGWVALPIDCPCLPF